MPATEPTLHVTNGDAAADAIRAAGIEGAVLPWRDVLHEGPVPAGLTHGELAEVRAQFLGAAGLAEYHQALTTLRTRDAVLETAERRDEVVLWFEHDLYDQLQLIQILDRFSDGPSPARLTLVQSNDYLGSLHLDVLPALHRKRVDVTREQIALAQSAWGAFRSPDPAAIIALLAEGATALPHLASAFERHLEEFPSTHNGLSRSEQQIVDVVVAEPVSPVQAFHRAHHQREAAYFLGDTVFATYLQRLSDIGDPLLLFDDGTKIRAPQAEHESNGFWHRLMTATAVAREIGAGHLDLVQHAGIARWLGGVRLEGRHAPWRWDPAQRGLIKQ